MGTEYVLKFGTDTGYICLDLDPTIMNFGVLHACLGLYWFLKNICLRDVRCYLLTAKSN